jgi:hypothetical protein
MLSYAGICSLWIPLLAWMMPGHSFRVGMLYLMRKDWTFEVRLRNGGLTRGAPGWWCWPGRLARVWMLVCAMCVFVFTTSIHSSLVLSHLQTPPLATYTLTHIHSPFPNPHLLAEFAVHYRRTTSLQDFVAASSLSQANGGRRALLLLGCIGGLLCAGAVAALLVAAVTADQLARRCPGCAALSRR